MRESEIELRAVAWAGRHGILSLKLNVRGQRGWPDRLFLKNGRACFIEFKSRTGKLTKLQSATIERLRRAGLSVSVCRSPDTAIMSLMASFPGVA